MKRPKANCKTCGREFLGWSGGRNTNEFCGRKCRGIASRAAGNPNWKGGVVEGPDGRLMVYAPNYPGSKVAGSYVLRARLVLETYLGRLLEPDEIAHHINGDKTDDRPENLQAMLRADHSRHHIGDRQDELQAARRRSAR